MINVITELKSIAQKTLHLKDTTDVRGTIDSIRTSTEIRGYNVWILACAAIIASIGLDLDSPAVIIGAMLISPLMSPILGIGLSIGINDRKHLIKALENFMVAFSAALIMSTLYFLLTPLGKMNASIASRTEPTLLDVLVAFTGGIAGIVAGSRKDITNAIPGVAIATALMPPVCVAGYGLANGNWPVFLGAFYLFFINSVFIALATFLIVRFLRFPLTEYQDKESRSTAFRWVLTFAFLISIPSAYLFFQVIERYQMTGRAETFIAEKVNNDNHQAISYRLDDQDSIAKLNIFMTGASISRDSISYLTSQLPNYKLEKTRLHFVQNLPPVSENEILSQARAELLSELQPRLEAQNQRMDSIKLSLFKAKQDSANIEQLERELFHLYPALQGFSYSALAFACENGKPRDTIPTIILTWKSNTTRAMRKLGEEQLGSWFPQRLGQDTCVVISR
ncbi:MAG: DUF389 domain-containing protein [Bacteroidia bacterium]|nr:DUF389 domain-containing protein [Bacteroidia bacterium]